MPKHEPLPRPARYAQRKLVDGRYVATGPDVVHGRGTTYIEDSCRCHYCERANLRLIEAWARAS